MFNLRRILEEVVVRSFKKGKRKRIHARGLKAKTEKNFDAPSQATQAEVAARATKARIAPINAEYLICKGVILLSRLRRARAPESAAHAH